MSSDAKPEDVNKFLSSVTHFTPTRHHDVYPRISPNEGLRHSANDLRVLITGAGRGIGRATAVAFAIAGARKVVITSRSIEQLGETEKEVKAMAGNRSVQVVKFAGDISRKEDVEKLFEAAGDLDGMAVSSPTSDVHRPSPLSHYKQRWVNKTSFLVRQRVTHDIPISRQNKSYNSTHPRIRPRRMVENGRGNVAIFQQPEEN